MSLRTLQQDSTLHWRSCAREVCRRVSGIQHVHLRRLVAVRQATCGIGGAFASRVPAGQHLVSAVRLLKLMY